MSRYFLLGTIALLLVLCFQPFAESADEKAAKPDSLAQQLVKLRQPVKIEVELDSLVLRDVLAQLEKDHDLKFVVLDESFGTDENPLALKFKKKQNLKGLSVCKVLDIALNDLNAKYRVCNEYIEIVHEGHHRDQSLVSAVIKERPFNEVVQELADEYGTTVVVAPQSGETRMGFVNARFRNVPFATALELLAVQVDLRVIKKPGAFLVTSAEHANQLDEEAHQTEMRKAMLQNVRKGILPGEPAK